MVQQEKEENDGNQSEREEARRQELIEALDEEGIGLNEESKLCKSYIANGSMGGWTAEMIATKLSQMRYLHEYTNYVSIKRRLVEEEHKSRYLHSLVIPEPRLNYRFPIESIKLAAIDEALQYKGFPDVMPWNTHAAKTRRHKLKASLEAIGLELRYDSKLCASYITDGPTLEWPLEAIVRRMAEMKYLFEYTRYKDALVALRKENEHNWEHMTKKEQREAKRAVEAQVLGANGYPSTWPWSATYMTPSKAPRSADVSTPKKTRVLRSQDDMMTPSKRQSSEVRKLLDQQKTLFGVANDTDASPKAKRSKRTRSESALD